jgi:Rod binding domain-containing protein
MTIGSTAGTGFAGADAQAKETGKLHQAARSFEALLVAQMLQSALQAGGGAPEGADSTMFEMGEQYLAEAISSRGGLGLAGLIEKQLTRAGRTPPETTGDALPARGIR